MNKKVDILKRLFEEGKSSYYVRELSSQIIATIPQKDKLAEIEKLHAFVRDEVRYLADPYGKEFFTSPDRMAKRILAGMTVSEDCESKAVLLASMLRSIGVFSEVVILDASANGRFSHAIARAILNGQKINLETTIPVRMGIAPKHTKEIIIK